MSSSNDQFFSNDQFSVTTSSSLKTIFQLPRVFSDDQVSSDDQFLSNDKISSNKRSIRVTTTPAAFLERFHCAARRIDEGLNRIYGVRCLPDKLVEGDESSLGETTPSGESVDFGLE